MHSYEVEQIYEINIVKLFEIIIDVEKYPEFLPWCIATSIVSRESDTIYADLMVDFKGLTEQYTSKITFEKPHLVHVEAVKGPFKNLTNIWKLESINDHQTKVYFSIDFEFKSKILNHLIGTMHTKIIDKITQAFKDRAYSLS